MTHISRRLPFAFYTTFGKRRHDEKDQEGRQEGKKSKAWATELPKLFFFFGGVALSERYKGTLCASDLLLLLSVMASQQNEVS